MKIFSDSLGPFLAGYFLGQIQCAVILWACFKYDQPAPVSTNEAKNE